MKKNLFILLLAFIAVSYNVHAQKKSTMGTCPKPLNPTAQLHSPSWYNVKLNWDRPNVSSSEVNTDTTMVYTNGPIVTNPGAGYHGLDVSVKIGSAGTYAGNAKKSTNAAATVSLADDFVLDVSTKITTIDFYGIQTFYKAPNYINYTDTTKSPFTGVYVKIFNTQPTASATPIWGDFTTNRLNQTSFARIYKVPNSNLSDTTRPLYKISAKIDATLPAGTYWVEVTLEGEDADKGVYLTPVTIPNEMYVGNAMQRNGTGNYGAWADPTNHTQLALAFKVNGVLSTIDPIAGYNVYRDGVKLNTSVLTEKTYADIASTGVHNYGITTVCKTDGESDTVSLRVEMPQNPCEIGVSTFPFVEGFEGGVTPPCWSQTYGGANYKVWTYRKGGYGNSRPEAAHSGNFNAFLTLDGASENVKLISPMLNVTNLEQPILTFFYTQADFGTVGSNNHDNLRIYYKNNADSAWTKLVTYDKAVEDWKKESLVLPNPTATYWIAFEGDGNGRGITLDDVRVGDTSSCEGIGNLAYTLHNPLWNSVNLTWSSSPDKKSTTAAGDDTILFTNGPIITDLGAGYQGKDISKAYSGNLGAVVQKNLGQGYESSMADDFTLTDTSFISYMNFYAFHYNTSTTSTISEVYVQIYDNAPNAGGHVIWGGEAENVMNNSYFSNIYRTPQSIPQDNNRPIFVVKANINKSLAPGTYWVDVTFKANVTYRANIPPVVGAGKVPTGNAIYFTKYPGGEWQAKPWTDDQSATGNAWGMPFDIYGVKGSAPTWTYNVYRNDVLLTPTPIKTTNYKDAAPGAGNYTYGVTKIWNTGCESAKTKVNFTIESDPCSSARKIPFIESFESGMMPNCWTQSHELGETEWAVVDALKSVPATAHDGNYKMSLKYQPATGGIGVITRLITPMLDLSTTDSNILLNFWHTQAVTEDGNQDSLFVYYKNTSSGTWKLLKKFTSPAENWEEAKIFLPNPTNTYWVAFEGIIGGGEGVLIDDIKIKSTGETSIENVTLSEETPIQIFPNPAKTKVTVQSAKPIQNIEIYNAMGQAVDNIRVSGSQQDIQVSSYNAGVYLIKVIMKDQSVSIQRIIISK